MPLSYFPPLPENIWGNMDGNIELQTDLVNYIELKSQSVSKRNNLIINPNFKIWQRCANQIAIASKSRLANTVTLETVQAHGYTDGDEIQITNMSDSTYDEPSNVAISYIDSTHFSYTNIGSDESNSSELGGFALLTNRCSIAGDNAEFSSDRWITLHNSNDIVLKPNEVSGISITSNATSKFALMQIVPSKYLEQYLEGKFSASIKVKSDNNSTVRVAIVSWNSTKDNTNKLAISSWNTIGTNPTLATNWTYEGISMPYTLSDDYQTIKLEEIEIATTNANNIALLIWAESTSIGENIVIDEAQLLTSSEITDFIPNDYEYDLDSCRKFFMKSYQSNSPLYHISEIGKTIFPTSYGTSDGNSFGTIHYSEMYQPPFITLMTANNPPTQGVWRVSTGSNIGVVTADVSEKSFSLINDSGFTISTSSISGHYVLSAEI